MFFPWSLSVCLVLASSSIVRFSIEWDLALKERVEAVEISLWTQEDVESEWAISDSKNSTAHLCLFSRMRMDHELLKAWWNGVCLSSSACCVSECFIERGTSNLSFSWRGDGFVLYREEKWNKNILWKTRRTKQFYFFLQWHAGPCSVPEVEKHILKVLYGKSVFFV
jgi:hypothetical protein